ncbi:MAG: hypothetical protein L0228_18045 [Planctomycetes bacterium]|nr:hypothetical protein [Planctomycetota bacterium]
MTRLSFMPLLVGSATLLSCLLCNNESMAQPVVLESAVMGTPGRFGGTSITTSQFVGWRFQTSQTLDVDHIGGHLLSFPDEPGDIFAALVRLQSIDSVPTLKMSMQSANATPREPLRANQIESHFPWKSPKRCSQKAGSLQQHHARNGQASRVMHKLHLPAKEENRSDCRSSRHGRDITWTGI